MVIRELAERIGARIATGEDRAEATIDGVCAGDRISDLLAQSGGTSLVVTNLVGSSLLRVAELMDIPAICLVSNAEPEPAMREAAGRQGIVLLVSPADMFETCGRLYRVLKGGA
jgi:ADP-heptose:LPS heptosyltransferase